MIRKLLATTAIATLVSTGAIAQTTTQPADATAPANTMQNPAAADQQMVVRADGNLASNIIGESVYNGTDENAERIGEVNDIVIGSDGAIQALVIGVGGFLGIGEKDVAIEYDLAQWIDRDNDRWLVVETSEEALKAQEEFDRLAYQPMPSDSDVSETRPATAEDLAAAPAEGEENMADDDMAAAPAGDAAPGSNTTAAAPVEGEAASDMAAAPVEGETADDMATAPVEGRTNETAAAPAEGEEVDVVVVAPDGSEQPAASDQTAVSEEAAPVEGTDQTRTAAIDRSTLQPMAAEDLTAENVIGTTVYGANEENIGEVGDLVLSQDGKIDAMIVNVGGFLGIGEKEVAVGLDKIEFMLDENGNRYVYTPFTQEQLEAQPEYDEAAYGERRDDMRMVVPN
jgi:sporulation protein YlmC with PRC-barrel domain